MSARRFRDGLLSPGITAALTAAALFGVGTPLAKNLLGIVDPWMMAGLFYAGSGISLTALRWLTPGSRLDQFWPSVLVLGACLAWAIDNNLTRKISLLDATWLASLKGVVAGSVNLLIALATGAAWPDTSTTLGALLIGSLSYGASLVLFVVALRHLGTARTAAYFSVAPFAGALVAVLWLQEPLSTRLALASAFMALGVWLHLTERHDHEHYHPFEEHEHEHVHDAHHRHDHDEP